MQFVLFRGIYLTHLYSKNIDFLSHLNDRIYSLNQQEQSTLMGNTPVTVNLLEKTETEMIAQNVPIEEIDQESSIPIKESSQEDFRYFNYLKSHTPVLFRVTILTLSLLRLSLETAVYFIE